MPPSALPVPVQEIIRREIDQPGSQEEVLSRLRDCYPDLEPLWQFLSLKDHQHRHSFYVKAEHVFCRRLGWRLMRPMLLLSVPAAVLLTLVFSRAKGIDATLAVGLFLGGIAAFYVVLQVFIHRWAWKDMRQLDSLDQDYRQKLARLLEEGR